MARRIPNINSGNFLIRKERLDFKNFVLKVNTDTFTYKYSPNIIELDETGKLFTLTLENKKLLIDILQVDDVRDYVDVYLFGVKQPQDRYDVFLEGNNIIVQFSSDITRLPNEVKINDFEIKGKIVEIV